MSRSSGAEAAGGILGCLVIIWWALKVIAVPIFIVNLIYLCNALSAGTMATFDWTWLIVSGVSLFVL